MSAATRMKLVPGNPGFDARSVNLVNAYRVGPGSKYVALSGPVVAKTVATAAPPVMLTGIPILSGAVYTGVITLIFVAPGGIGVGNYQLYLGTSGGGSLIAFGLIPSSPATANGLAISFPAGASWSDDMVYTWQSMLVPASAVEEPSGYGISDGEDLVLAAGPEPIDFTANATLPSHSVLARCDTNGGAFTLTMPTTPHDGQIMKFKDVGQVAGTHAITIAAGAGWNIEPYTVSGAPGASTQINASRGSAEFVADTTRNVWWVQALR